MWENFFNAGGWGMYPTSVLGFITLVAIVLHALRPEPRYGRVISAFGIATFTSGLLGTCVGIAKTVHYLDQVPKDEQFLTLAIGCEESLHVLVLALLILTLAAIVSGVLALRQRRIDRAPL
ncbi:MAG TPA: hypothetical protein VFQ53_02215 [Kofleriaceae bacterium]|nr:hypothetical protein [Kofleriaceae bacterium]